jgi:hypothetical protein
MGEPSLWKLSRSGVGATVYRLLWLPTFHAPVCIRIVKSDKIRAHIVELDGTGGFDPGKVSVRRTKVLTEGQWDSVQTLLARAHYWKMPARVEADPQRGWVLDGGELVCEGVEDGRYHVVDRDDPERDYENFCWYVLELSGLGLRKRWIQYHRDELREKEEKKEKDDQGERHAAFPSRFGPRRADNIGHQGRFAWSSFFWSSWASLGESLVRLGAVQLRLCSSAPAKTTHQLHVCSGNSRNFPPALAVHLTRTLSHDASRQSPTQEKRSQPMSIGPASPESGAEPEPEGGSEPERESQDVRSFDPCSGNLPVTTFVCDARDRLVEVQTPGGGGCDTVYRYEPPHPVPSQWQWEHLPEKRLYALTANGKTEYWRDNPNRYLVVEVDDETGEVNPTVTHDRPVYIWLCREEREAR